MTRTGRPPAGPAGRPGRPARARSCPAGAGPAGPAARPAAGWATGSRPARPRRAPGRSRPARARVAQRRQVDEHDAVAEVPATRPATSMASRVLPTPPGPGERQQLGTAPVQQPHHRRGRAGPPDQRRQRPRQPGAARAREPARPASGPPGRRRATASRLGPFRRVRAERVGQQRDRGQPRGASRSRSRSLMALALTPARSARASWVSPAASRCRLSSAAKLAAPVPGIGATATGPGKRENSGSARPVARICRHRPWDQAARRDRQGAQRCPPKS